MSQPNYHETLADAKKLYKEEVEEIKTNPPHTPIGDCTSECRRSGCPLDEIIPFEDWLEEQNYKHRDN